MGLLSLTSCTSTKMVAVPVRRLPAGPLSAGGDEHSGEIWFEESTPGTGYARLVKIRLIYADACELGKMLIRFPCPFLVSQPFPAHKSVLVLSFQTGTTYPPPPPPISVMLNCKGAALKMGNKARAAIIENTVRALTVTQRFSMLER